MGRVSQSAGGGLTAADRAKLIPANIRQGVTLFAGTSHEVTGALLGTVAGGPLSDLGVQYPAAVTGGVNGSSRNASAKFYFLNAFDVTYIENIEVVFSVTGDTIVR